MIEARRFVDAASDRGFDFWAGVPCSFLTPFINYTIGDDRLTYVSAANEGDAVAAATGAALGGHRSVAMMQNSGLGNAVSPLTSLNAVFRVPVLLIVTLRGEAGTADEPQHELMGEITTQLLETMNIAWDWFPDRDEAIDAVLKKAMSYMDSQARPFALIMKKGMVLPHALTGTAVTVRPAAQVSEDRAGHPGWLPTRQQVLKSLVENTDPAKCIVIASTGFTGRQLYAIEDRSNQFYMVGSMGCASSLGLGLSLVRPDRKVIVVDGDGALLMRMGNLATVGAYAKDNYYHLLLDNGVHESTGGQATVSPVLDYPALALAAGYRHVMSSTATGADFSDIFAAGSPAMMYLRTARGVPENLPRPSVKPRQVARRLMDYLGVNSPWAVG